METASETPSRCGTVRGSDKGDWGERGRTLQKKPESRNGSRATVYSGGARADTENGRAEVVADGRLLLAPHGPDQVPAEDQAALRRPDLAQRPAGWAAGEADDLDPRRQRLQYRREPTAQRGAW